MNNSKYFFQFLGILYFFLAGSNNIQAQVAIDTLSRFAEINLDVQKNQVVFHADTPALSQIAGAPEAFYTYFWEFGDGHYSFEEQPTHTYAQSGDYNVRLVATNNYDDGKPPISRPKPTSISEISESNVVADENAQLLTEHNAFRLLKNREPMPNETMEMVLSYVNDKPYATDGRIYLFFNDQQFEKNNFDLPEIRMYYGEYASSDSFKELAHHSISQNDFILSTGWEPSEIGLEKIPDSLLKQNLQETLTRAYEEYRNVKVIDYDQMPSGQTRNIFFTFKTTPEMLKDTSAILTVKSVWIPERTYDIHQVRTMEMEIVTSHDPNKMAVYNARLNYRMVRGKEMKYKIRFQNNGEGPAKTIRLDTEVPEIFDKKSLKIIDTYPKVPICPDGQDVNFSCIDTLFYRDKISFVFKNIYLPGSQQKGVQERDSTKGFVKYSLAFGKDFHKIKTRSQTAIIFDKNEPIITNTATTRFKPGFSPGIRMGYNYTFPKESKTNRTVTEDGLIYTIDQVGTKETSRGFFMGATYSPYKAYKKYFQTELYLERQFSNSDAQFEFLLNSATGNVFWLQRTESMHIEQTNLQFVPASFRYNLNSVFGVGVGVITHFRWSGTITDQLEKRYFQYNSANPDELGTEIPDFYSNMERKTALGFHWEDAAPFVDITGGISRIGPSAGIRYLYPIKNQRSILQFYAIWKF
ncbi:MAG: PKD domain-containing protein [Flavobacteriaceae bacterium]|nr:PKD domain-containing protein [Flavobacteriaceae bacterium]